MTNSISPGGARRETFFEFTSMGAQIRVAAIDAETGIEVVIIAPATASQLHMQRIAKAKLDRRLAKELDS
ncbi:MAG: serine hydroxymethyltransferase [Devosiaceae bacterium]|nr:serine hydroxymethyltransferase [Devosiaceae bacterium]